MIDAQKVKEHAEVIGADGVHVGTVDRVEGDRIKLTKRDGANGAVAVSFEEEEGGKSAH